MERRHVKSSTPLWLRREQLLRQLPSHWRNAVRVNYEMKTGEITVVGQFEEHDRPLLPAHADLLEIFDELTVIALEQLKQQQRAYYYAYGGR